MLFPSFVLGNASGEGGTLLVPLSPFFPLFSLSLLSSPSPSFSLSLSQSLFLSFSISFSFPFALSLPLFPSLLRFFFFEGTACTVYFRDVRNDTADCNQLYLYCNKEQYIFSRMNLCTPMCVTFSLRSLSELFFFY